MNHRPPQTRPANAFSPLQEWMGRVVVRYMTRLNIEIYKATKGRLMGSFPGGAPILLLNSTGRKSGRRRTAALLYLEKEGKYYIVGSLGGMSHHPAWALNLEETPACSIQTRGKEKPMTARRLSDEEKAQVWPDLVAMYPDYNDYQSRTTRNIRVYELTPR